MSEDEEWTHEKTVTLKVRWAGLERWNQGVDQACQEWRDEMDRQIKEDTDKHRRQMEEYRRMDGLTPAEVLKRIMKG